jgi:hypothetical protein
MLLKIIQENFASGNISANDLRCGINSGKYDLNPEHQREVVHNDTWKSKIIQSIIKYGNIPPLYFHMCAAEDGEEEFKYESLDGKQRCTAIFEFLENKLKYDLEDTFEHNGEIYNLKKLYFKDLPEKLRRFIWNFQITIMTWSQKMSQSDISNFFENVQQAKTTTTGELLNSKTEAPTRAIMKELISYENFQEFKKDTKRKQKWEYVVNMLYVYTKWKDIPNNVGAILVVKKPERLCNWYTSYKSDDSNKFITLFKELIDLLEQFKHTKLCVQDVTALFLYFLKCNQGAEADKIRFLTFLEKDDMKDFRNVDIGKYTRSEAKYRIIEKKCTEIV